MWTTLVKMFTALVDGYWNEISGIYDFHRALMKERNAPWGVSYHMASGVEIVRY